MRIGRVLVVSVTVSIVVCVNIATATLISIPNGSFESPDVPAVSPYAVPVVQDWQKAPPPAWLLMAGYTADDWNNMAGTFFNPAVVDNLDGEQGAFLFGVPGVELFQDLATSFQAGRSYHLTVAVEGGGGYLGNFMKIGTPMDIRLYYRDDAILVGDNRVVIGSTAIQNANASGGLITHLNDYHLDLPVVSATDPWAGKSIGIQLISTVPFVDAGGYWDIDNVRLSELPEPTSIGLVVAGAILGLRRRRRA